MYRVTVPAQGLWELLPYTGAAHPALVPWNRLCSQGEAGIISLQLPRWSWDPLPAASQVMQGTSSLWLLPCTAPCTGIQGVFWLQFQEKLRKEKEPS